MCLRLWPLAIHYLVPTAVSLAFAVVHASLRDAATFEAWELTADLLTLLAWTAAGLIDLVLLLKVLPSRRVEEVNAGLS